MQKFIGIAVFIGLITILFYCCKEDKPNNVVDVDPPVKIDIPKFSGDSAYAFVAKQVAFGPRVPNTQAHRDCADWFVETFEKYGATVTRQKFQATAYTGTVLNGQNIVASYNPNATKRIFISAHWDTRPFGDEDADPTKHKTPIAGADDGGSGVGVILEIARQLNLQKLDANFGVDLILFDAEDYGESGAGSTESWCLGSQHWSRTPHKSGYRADFGILLDMVGSKGARFTKEGTSMQYAGNVMNKVWKIAAKQGFSGYFDNAQTNGVIDDHYFVNRIAKIPTIDIINRTGATESNFGAYWHTHDDDMDIIDKNTLRATGQTVLAVIYTKAAGEF